MNVPLEYNGDAQQAANGRPYILKENQSLLIDPGHIIARIAVKWQAVSHRIYKTAQ